MHFFLFLYLSTDLIHQLHSYTKILTLVSLLPISSFLHFYHYSSYSHSYSPHTRPDSPYYYPDSFYSHHFVPVFLHSYHSNPDSPYSHHSPHSVPQFPVPDFIDSQVTNETLILLKQKQ